MPMQDLTTQVALIQQSVDAIARGQKEMHEETKEWRKSVQPSFDKMHDTYDEVFGDDARHSVGLKRTQKTHGKHIRQLQGFAVLLLILIALGYFGPDAKAAVNDIKGIVTGG